jgi:hypothetical protein
MLTQHLISHRGERFIGVSGVITRTQMGIDLDHPQFRIAVEVEKNDGIQAFMQMISVPAQHATANLQTAVLGILNAAQAADWERLAGQRVIALYRDDHEGRLGRIAGLCDTEGENIFLALRATVDA